MNSESPKEKQAEAQVQQKKPEAAKPAVRAEQPPQPVESPKPINKELKKELQKQQKVFEQLEQRLAELNKEKDRIEASLSTPEIYADKEKFRKAEADYKKVSDECVQLNKEYEKVFEKIMELEQKNL